MMRGATLLWAALAAAIGTGLFVLKYEVQEEEQKLRVLRKDIAQAHEAIHVAKAEWSYLNDPLRLKEQAEHHLGLHSLKPGQVAAIDQLPMAQPASASATADQAPPTPKPVSTPVPPKAAQLPAKPPARSPPAKAPARTPAPMTTAAVQPKIGPPASLVANRTPPQTVLPPDNVMVITSPAVLEPEMASVRRHP